MDKNKDHVIKYHCNQSKETDVPLLPMRSLIMDHQHLGNHIY